MKRAFLFLSMVAALCACSNRANKAESTEEADSTMVAEVNDSIANADETIVTVETLKYEKSDSTAEVSLLIQWPTEGPQPLVDSLRHHIGELLMDDNFSGPKSIQTYGESLFESLSADWHSVYDEMSPDERSGALTRNYSITVLTQTDSYITYHYHHFDYGGGAHGYTTEAAFSFRKSDGKQIPLLANTNSPKFAKLLKEGVRSFFSEEKPLSDEELLEYLFAEEVSALNHLPLPGNAPYLSETGVVFCYTQYEIAPYSSGIITFEVPFKHITPFLTEEAKSMIPRQ